VTQILTNLLVDQLKTRDLDLNGRRIVNCAASKDQADVVIRKELTSGYATKAELDQAKTDLSVGLTVTITTAPLTGGGTTGSMTFFNGRLVAQVQAT